MSKIESFSSDTAFLAIEHFPYGMRRSGYFTISQAEKLEKYGHAYQALFQGNREPVNEEEQRFIKVCLEKAEPSSEHEVLWMYFLEKVNQTKSKFSVRPSSKEERNLTQSAYGEYSAVDAGSESDEW